MKDDIHIDMEWDQRKISFPLPKEEFSSFYSVFLLISSPKRFIVFSRCYRLIK